LCAELGLSSNSVYFGYEPRMSWTIERRNYRELLTRAVRGGRAL